jgi:hypothetical protein
MNLYGEKISISAVFRRNLACWVLKNAFQRLEYRPKQFKTFVFNIDYALLIRLKLFFLGY